MWHPNSNQHKAKHGGYKKKHSQTAISAQMNMYAAVAAIVKAKTNITPVKIQPGAQLKFNF